MRQMRLSAESDASGGNLEAAGDTPIRMTGEHLTVALDELLDSRSKLTRVLLGAAHA